MTEQVTRRNFFKLLGGGVALAVAPSIAVAEKIINIPVEFGWTWYIDKNKVPATLSEIITKTLRDNTQKICENVSINNSLLMKLKDGQKVKLNIENISIDEQNKRIADRMQKRYEENNKVPVRYRIPREEEKKAINHFGDMTPINSYVCYEDIEKKYLEVLNGAAKITPTAS